MVLASDIRILWTLPELLVNWSYKYLTTKLCRDKNYGLVNDRLETLGRLRRRNLERESL